MVDQIRVKSGVLLGAVVSGALAAGTLTAAPTANATCASFWGIGNSADCTSKLFSVAIAIGGNAQAHADGLFGAAFSIGTGETWILTAIACSVVVFVVLTARRLGSRGWALALGLLLGGSLGNLSDRMFRAPGPGRGQVVDFLQLPHYPIFNIADSAIVSAAVLIALLAFRGVRIDGTRASGDPLKHQSAEGPSAEQQSADSSQGSDHDV